MHVWNRKVNQHSAKFTTKLELILVSIIYFCGSGFSIYLFFYVDLLLVASDIVINLEMRTLLL